jgi:hypothetical protein
MILMIKIKGAWTPLHAPARIPIADSRTNSSGKEDLNVYPKEVVELL